MIPEGIVGNQMYLLTGDQLQAFGITCATQAVQSAQQLWKKQHDAMFDPVLRIEQVAEIFDVKKRTIENWVSHKIIRPTKIGSVVRFDGEEIARIKSIYKQ